jgi:S-layer homology domain
MTVGVAHSGEEKMRNETLTLQTSLPVAEIRAKRCQFVGSYRRTIEPIRRKKLFSFVCLVAAACLSSPMRAMPQVRIENPNQHIGGLPPGLTVSTSASVVKINPTFGSEGTKVVITGGPTSNLSGATAVYFGGVPAGFATNADGTLLANAPAGGGPPSVSVAVTVLLGGVLLPSTATFTYQVGELMVSGPLPYSPTLNGDLSWNNPNPTGYFMSLASLPNNGSIAFPDFLPTLHLATSFQDNRPAIEYNYNLNPQVLCPWEPADAPIEAETTCAAAGNEGRFTAYLFFCDVMGSSQSGSGSCTNWDGNAGWWMPASICDSASPTCTTSVTESLATSGPSKNTVGDLPIPLGSMFSSTSLARTLKLTSWIAQLSTDPATVFPNRQDSVTSIFNVVIAPTAMLQTSAVPYTLIYAPPGNQSVVNFTASSQYGSQFSVENDQEKDNLYSAEQNANTGFSLKVAGFSLTGSAGSTSGWDSTTIQGFGQVNSTTAQDQNSLAFSFTWPFPANPNLVPGSGAVCASQTDCSKTTTISNAYALEPFWADTFILLVHPEFTAWVVSNSQSRYAFYGSVPTTIDATVLQLDFCKRGQVEFGQNQCTFEYSASGIALAKTGQAPVYNGQSESITLSQTDAANLLMLDPFYVGGQSAALATNRAVPVSSTTYGAKIGEPARPFGPQTITNTQAQTATGKAQQSSYSTVTSVQSQGSSYGAEINASGGKTGATEGVTYTVGSKDTSSTTLKYTYVDSTATSKQNVTQASVTLNDVDNTTTGSSGPSCKICHNPLPDQPSVNIYLDRLFGTFMFQDPRAPGASDVLHPVLVPVAVSTLHLMTILTGEEMSQNRFSDITQSDPARGMIGFLAREKILPGTAKALFAPGALITRGQLAAALASSLQIKSPASPESAFSDILGGTPLASSVKAAVNANLINPATETTFDPGGSISRQDLAVALARGFSLSGATAPTVSDAPQVSASARSSVAAVVAKGYLKAFSDNTFRPTTFVTREEAAEAIYLALYDRTEEAARTGQ